MALLAVGEERCNPRAPEQNQREEECWTHSPSARLPSETQTGIHTSSPQAFKRLQQPSCVSSLQMAGVGLLTLPSSGLSLSYGSIPPVLFLQRALTQVANAESLKPCRCPLAPDPHPLLLCSLTSPLSLASV